MHNETPILSVRIPSDLLSRVDKFVATGGKAMRGMQFTRTDAIRILLTAALDAQDRKAAKGGAK